MSRAVEEEAWDNRQEPMVTHCIARHCHTNVHPENQTHRHTHTRTHAHTHTQRHTDIHTGHIGTHRHTHTHRDTQTDTHTHRVWSGCQSSLTPPHVVWGGL